jgi:hypothetical protein
MTESASALASVVYWRKLYPASLAQEWTASGPTGTRGTGKPFKAAVTRDFEFITGV